MAFWYLILEANISHSPVVANVLVPCYSDEGKDVGQLHSWSQGSHLLTFITDIRKTPFFKHP